MTYLGIEARHSDSRSSAEERARFARLRDAERRRQEAADATICDEIWSAAGPIEATPAEAYLWGRSLICETPELRFHPAAPRTKDRDKTVPPCPAMVALVRSHDGQPKALHLTFLTADGKKAFGDRSRLMFGAVGGHAVQLALIGPGRVLAVGEGIETCGSYSVLKGRPCWAALSTAGLHGFYVPRGVRKLVIAADGDRAGMKAAQALAERASRVCDVEIDPAPEGKDWADILVASHV
jgi:putative DNA primase/helicase